MDTSSRIENQKDKYKKHTQHVNNRSGKEHVVRTTPQRLQELLKQGTMVVTNMWNYSANDWVSSVYAADVDNDGDIEVLLGSRDGYVRALTRWGSLKWETRLGSGKWVSAIVAVPQFDNTAIQARVIVGSRDGKIYALDQNGSLLSEWEEYDTKSVVRQVYIHPEHPEYLVVGSENHGVYILDCVTGKLLHEPFFAQGAITSVSFYDVDGDGTPEVLAGSADKHVYILNNQGRLLGKFFTDNKVYALHVACLEPQGQPTLLVSTNGKDLAAWAVKRHAEAQLVFERKWIITSKKHVFENRLLAICVADLNQDGYKEIIVGSEDKHLYILSHDGKLLWKYAVGACVYSVAAADINVDGIIEVIVGLEDNQVRVFHLDLISNLYADINQTYKTLGRVRNKAIEALSMAEYTLLKDIIEETAPPQHRMELAYAKFKKDTRLYEQALPILLRLRQQRVQYYWSKPLTNVGHIRAFCLGDVAGDPKDEIILGNEEGQIIAIDIQQERVLWRTLLGKRIWMAQMGTTNLNEYDTLLASLADERVHVVSNAGAVLHDKELTLEGDERVWCVHINKQGENTQNEIREIIVGSDRKIYLYDANLQELRTTIHSPQGVSLVCTYDITSKASAEIICAGMDHQVYVYSRDAKELWRYPTQDRIRAICTKDIDGDNHAEILVGSEDRYVYVLDHQGHLKWRYYMPHRVLSVDALDIDKDGKCEILVGVADSYVYVLSAEGDQRWKFKANDRVRAVCAKDMNNDGVVEIAVASEDQLNLLQVLDMQKLEKQINECIREKQLEDFTVEMTPKETVLKLTQDDDEYVRAYALTLVAGYHNLTSEDFDLLQNSIKDKSLEVRKGMVLVIVNMCKVTRKDDRESIKQLRRFLDQLSIDPDQELRVTLINLLYILTEMDPSLCFEYLERFTHNIDVWVRRAVVRQLDKLVEAYPRQTRRLLLETVQDHNAWIRQESGRSLAHYFDAHTKELVTGLQELLMLGIDSSVILQMSYSAKQPLVQKTLTALARALTERSETNMPDALDEMVRVLEEASDTTIDDDHIDGSEEASQVYQELGQLLRTKTIDDVVQYQRVTDVEFCSTVPRFKHVMHIFDNLMEVAKTLRVFQRREAYGDRASSLLEANSRLEEIRKDIQAESVHRAQQTEYVVHLPEDFVFSIVLRRWQDIVAAQLQGLRGEAKLSFELPEQIVLTDEQVVVSLRISNTGRCPADNVRVKLKKGEDFTILKNDECKREEIPTSGSITVEFYIHPHKERLRLEFTILFDDAEKRDKKLHFADELRLHEFRGLSFKEIHNPYKAGTPVNSTDMFYGREEDLAFLGEKLNTTSANTIVTLTGQRRSGKTSLIYQLMNGAHLLGPHCPVFVDLQALALKSNASQLLASIAQMIFKTLREKGINVPRPNEAEFEHDPTALFDQFLERVTDVLSGSKLVLLFDEFETLEQKIGAGQLKEDFLLYLRSIMQHREGINFLLAGAPRMRNLTEGYWSIFFNTTSHRSLTKLKPEEAQALIEKPVRELTYDHLAIEKIRQLTGDQPYLIQIICETLIRHCNRKQKNYVNINDVNVALDSVLESNINQFAWIWKQLEQIPGARFVLSILAQEKGSDGRLFLLADIKEHYDRQGLLYEREKVLQLLHYLVQEDFVEQGLDDTQFRIPVGLIRAWLRKIWPPEKVARVEALEKA